VRGRCTQNQAGQTDSTARPIQTLYVGRALEDVGANSLRSTDNRMIGGVNARRHRGLGLEMHDLPISKNTAM